MRLSFYSSFSVICFFTALLVVSAPGFAQMTAAKNNGADFAALQSWKGAVARTDAAALKLFYSTNPAADIRTAKAGVDVDSEVNFWTGLKARSIQLEVEDSTSPQPGLQQLALQLEVHPAHGKIVYVSAVQLWQQQNGKWLVVSENRTEPARLQQPLSTTRQIYPEGADAHEEIKAALEEAGRGHKRVLVVFGANWCYDCHVLDTAFHRPELVPIIEKNYKVVHIDIGRGDKNQDLMQQYDVPMKRGIPGLAVLASDGKLLYSQKNGEFEKARSLAPEDLLAFLEKWKPGRS